MTTAAALVTLTADAQPSRRSVQSSLRDERGFATELQRALRMGDRDAVAGVVRYPARVSVRQRPFPIYVKDRAALADMYDMVFTPHVRCAIVESREPAAGEPTKILVAPRSGCRVSRRRPHHRRGIARQIPNYADDLLWRYIDAPGDRARSHSTRDDGKWNWRGGSLKRALTPTSWSLVQGLAFRWPSEAFLQEASRCASRGGAVKRSLMARGRQETPGRRGSMRAASIWWRSFVERPTASLLSSVTC